MDPRDARAELMLGQPQADAPHLTRNVGKVHSISVLTSPTGADLGLRISHGEGQTLLTFTGGV